MPLGSKPNTYSEIPENETLKRYQGFATTRGEQKTGRSLYTSLAKYFGAGVLAGALVSGKKLDAPVAVGALGLLYGLRQESLAASPGWKEQIAKLNSDNISDKTVSIGGKTYLLAKGFDKIESAGYGFGFLNTPNSPSSYYMTGDGNHYEIYLMPDDTRLVDLFLDITNLLNAMSDDVKQKIAFIALRPTPRVYDTNAITSLFSRQVLPRIVICFKSEQSKKQDVEMVIRPIKNFIDSLVKANKVQTSGYHPRYSAKITDTDDIIYVGFGSGDYKKLPYRSDEFERKGPPLWRAYDDMAYQKGREQELKMTVPQ
jgi:hypothetical protein